MGGVVYRSPRALSAQYTSKRQLLEALLLDGIRTFQVYVHATKPGKRQRGHSELYRGPDYVVNLLPKIKLEVLVADDRVDEMIGVVREAAHTGRIGGGKIVVVPVEEVVRVRTGERGEGAV